MPLDIDATAAAGKRATQTSTRSGPGRRSGEHVMEGHQPQGRWFHNVHRRDGIGGE